MSSGNMPYRPRGAVEHRIYSFLILALDVWVLNATPRSLSPRESLATHCRGDRVNPRVDLDGYGEEQISCSDRFSNPGPSSL